MYRMCISISTLSEPVRTFLYRFQNDLTSYISLTPSDGYILHSKHLLYLAFFFAHFYLFFLSLFYHRNYSFICHCTEWFKSVYHDTITVLLYLASLYWLFFIYPVHFLEKNIQIQPWVWVVSHRTIENKRSHTLWIPTQFTFDHNDHKELVSIPAAMITRKKSLLQNAINKKKKKQMVGSGKFAQYQLCSNWRLIHLSSAPPH